MNIEEIAAKLEQYIDGLSERIGRKEAKEIAAKFINRNLKQNGSLEIDGVEYDRKTVAKAWQLVA